MLKVLIEKIRYPAEIRRNEEIGSYLHVQEFHAAQLKLLME